ncbi:MAG: GatB/YqeY domain-containing protein [Granulosicoccaceae bacterium]
MSEIIQRIKTSTIEAMRAGDKPRLTMLRSMSAAFKQIEVDERIELDDTRALAVLDKMCKQRRESSEQFAAAGRDDLLAQEQAELVILQEFMPAQLSEAELDSLIDEALTSTGAASIKEMGKVMGLLKPQLAGRADMSAVSAAIKAKLSA